MDAVDAVGELAWMQWTQHEWPYYDLIRGTCVQYSCRRHLKTSDMDRNLNFIHEQLGSVPCDARALEQ